MTWEIVEVEMVEEVRELVPVKVVLPPCKDKMLLLRVRVPVPVVMVLPLMVVKLGVAGKVKVWTLPVEVTLKMEPETVVAKVWLEPLWPFKLWMPETIPKVEVATRL